MKLLTKILLSLLTIAGELKYGEGRGERLKREGRDKLNVHIDVPKYVKVGDTAVLQCIYDLGGNPLYAMKWYKGNQEFYRFTPKEIPPTKTFPIPGLQIDLQQSNANQLTLKRVDLNMSGKYSCEVTTDYDFNTDLKTSYLYVVAYPERKPEIVLYKRHYAVGDLLEANCSSYRSKPAANLTWKINEELVQVNAGYQYAPHEKKFRESDNKETSHIGIRFVVEQSHFKNGRLKLICLAKIQNLYHQTTEETIFEENRPKLSSVVDNSSSTGSGTTNRYKNAGSSQSNSAPDVQRAHGEVVLAVLLISTASLFRSIFSLNWMLNGQDLRGRREEISSGLSLPLLMRSKNSLGVKLTLCPV